MEKVFAVSDAPLHAGTVYSAGPPDPIMQAG